MIESSSSRCHVVVPLSFIRSNQPCFIVIDVPIFGWSDLLQILCVYRQHFRLRSLAPLYLVLFKAKSDDPQTYSPLSSINKCLTGSEIDVFRQAPTGDWNFFFSRHMEKCGRQKLLIKMFPSQRNTNQNFWSPDGKFWSPIFLSRIRTKRTRLWPQWWRLFR